MVKPKPTGPHYQSLLMTSRHSNRWSFSLDGLQPLSPTVSEVRSLQDQLAISQVSSAKQISLLRQQLAAQAQAFTAGYDEMRVFMTNATV